MLDPEQGDDEAVTLGLGKHAVARVDQDDGQLTGRGPRGHVAGVLFVPRGVGDDELPLLRREVAIGHIDGNSLFPLGLKTVDEERQVELIAGGALALTIALDRGKLIFIDQLGVMEQSADERALAVIDAAAGQEAKQLLVLVPGEIGLDVFLDQLLLVVLHQK